MKRFAFIAVLLFAIFLAAGLLTYLAVLPVTAFALWGMPAYDMGLWHWSDRVIFMLAWWAVFVCVLWGFRK